MNQGFLKGFVLFSIAMSSVQISHAEEGSRLASNVLNGIYKIIKSESEPINERCPSLEYFQLRVSKAVDQTPMTLHLDEIVRGFGIINASDLMEDSGITSTQEQDEKRLLIRISTNKIADGYAMRSTNQQKINWDNPKKIIFGSLLKTVMLTKDEQGQEILVIAGYLQSDAGDPTKLQSWQCRYLKLQSEIYLGYFGDGNGSPQLVTP